MFEAGTRRQRRRTVWRTTRKHAVNINSVGNSNLARMYVTFGDGFDSLRLRRVRYLMLTLRYCPSPSATIRD